MGSIQITTLNKNYYRILQNPQGNGYFYSNYYRFRMSSAEIGRLINLIRSINLYSLFRDAKNQTSLSCKVNHELIRVNNKCLYLAGVTTCFSRKLILHKII